MFFFNNFSISGKSVDSSGHYLHRLTHPKNWKVLFYGLEWIYNVICGGFELDFPISHSLTEPRHLLWISPNTIELSLSLFSRCLPVLFFCQAQPSFMIIHSCCCLCFSSRRLENVLYSVCQWVQYVLHLLIYLVNDQQEYWQFLVSLSLSSWRNVVLLLFLPLTCIFHG